MSSETVQLPAAVSITDLSTLGRAGLRGENENQWAILAALRFLLAGEVACRHLFVCQSGAGGLLLRVSTAAGSLAAVLGFLVISGYSIASSIEREPRQFLVRRAWRLLPVYWFCLLLALIDFRVFGDSIPTASGSYMAPTLPELAANCVMLQDVLTQKVWTLGPSWSLSIEAIWYVAALPLAALIRRGRVDAVVGVAGMSAAAYILRVYLPHALLAEQMWGLSALELGWAWVVGFLFWRYRSKPWAQYLLLGLGPCLLAYDNDQEGGYAAMLFELVAIALIAAPSIRLPRRLVPAMLWLGDVSYPLYLAHFPVYCALYARFGPLPSWVCVSAALGAAVAVYYLVDRPSRRYHRRRALRRQPALSAGGAAS